LPADAPVIAAGSGQHVVARLATRLGRPCLGFAELVSSAIGSGEWGGYCAPAVAVALLADQDGDAPA